MFEGERQVCHVLVICAAMLVEHGQPVEGILQVFITVFCVL